MKNFVFYKTRSSDVGRGGWGIFMLIVVVGPSLKHPLSLIEKIELSCYTKFNLVIKY